MGGILQERWDGETEREVSTNQGEGEVQGLNKFDKREKEAYPLTALLGRQARTRVPAIS